MRIAASQLFLILLLLLSLISCSLSSFQKTTNRQNPNKEELTLQFQSESPRTKEVFRLFVSSDDYIRRQLKKNKIFSLREDISGDLAFNQEIAAYDKINFKGKAIVKLFLYEDTGTIAKLRFVLSSGISEIDKMISEDITRWSFEFFGNTIPEPFEVSFYILLSNKISKAEARATLKEFVPKTN